MDAYNDPCGLAFRKAQCDFSAKLVHLCSELSDEELALKCRMDSHVRRVLQNKRVVLFKRFLDDLQYPESKVADEMAEGFPLCGWLPSSGVFPTRIRPPEIHEEFLWKMSAVNLLIAPYFLICEKPWFRAATFALLLWPWV